MNNSKYIGIFLKTVFERKLFLNLQIRTKVSQPLQLKNFILRIQF